MLIQITASVMMDNLWWHVIYRRRCNGHLHAERLAVKDLNMLPNVKSVSIHSTKWIQAWDTMNLPGDIINGRGSIRLIALPEENHGTYVGRRFIFVNGVTISEPLLISERDAEAELIRNRLGDITFETI